MLRWTILNSEHEGEDHGLDPMLSFFCRQKRWGLIGLRASTDFTFLPSTLYKFIRFCAKIDLNNLNASPFPNERLFSRDDAVYLAILSNLCKSS
jgi:hypothetical protein